MMHPVLATDSAIAWAAPLEASFDLAWRPQLESPFVMSSR